MTKEMLKIIKEIIYEVGLLGTVFDDAEYLKELAAKLEKLIGKGV